MCAIMEYCIYHLPRWASMRVWSNLLLIFLHFMISPSYIPNAQANIHTHTHILLGQQCWLFLYSLCSERWITSEIHTIHARIITYNKVISISLRHLRRHLLEGNALHFFPSYLKHFFFSHIRPNEPPKRFITLFSPLRSIRPWFRKKEEFYRQHKKSWFFFFFFFFC